MTIRYVVEQDPPLSEDFLEYLYFLFDVPDGECGINLPISDILLKIKDEIIKSKFKKDLEYLFNLSLKKVDYIEFIFKPKESQPIEYF